jgi:hypothetical protein
MSLISIMCSRTLLQLLKVLLESLFIRVLANTLSELTICSSMAYMNFVTLLHFLIEPLMPLVT